MGAILSRIITRKDDKTTTDTRSTNLRKRWSWRSNKKPTDVTDTTVNRSSTMPARSRLQTTEEISEDRKHDDIFDDHNEINDLNIKSNESNHTIQLHSNEQHEQMNVACVNKSPICELPKTKDENQSNETSSTNQIENKDNIKQTISTNEADLLIAHVLPNQESIDPSKNMIISETNNPVTDDDNINVGHINDILVDKQDDGASYHSTHDTSIVTNESTNNIRSLEENNIHSQLNEIIQDSVKMEQTLPIEVPSEKIEEFIHQETLKYGSNEQIKVENVNIKPEIEEIINSEDEKLVQSSPGVGVDMNEQIFSQPTVNIDSSETFKHSDLMYETVEQRDIFACSAEPSALLNLSNNEALNTSELIDSNNTVDVIENEDIVNDILQEVNEPKHFINPNESQDYLSDGSINLNTDICVEQTKDVILSKNFEHEESLHYELMSNQPVECLLQPHLALNQSYSETSIITEHINVNEATHDEQTDGTPVSEDVEHKETLHEERMPAEPVVCLSHPEVTLDPSYNESSINLNEAMHDEQTDGTPVSEDVEHKDTLHEEIMPAEPVVCFSHPEVTLDPSYNESSIKLDEAMHGEQTDGTPVSEDVEHKDTLHEEIMPVEPVVCFSQPDSISNPPHNLSPLDRDINFGEFENVSHSECNINNDISTDKLIYTEVTDRLDEDDIKSNLPLNEPHFGLETNQDNTTDNIHHEDMNNTESMVTFDNFSNKFQNTLNSTHIDHDQHHIIQVHHGIDIPLNSTISNTHLHTDLINPHDIQQHSYDNFNSLLMNNENIDNSKLENEANCLIQSILNNVQENINNENSNQIDLINTNSNLLVNTTTNNSNLDDSTVNNNNHHDINEIKHDDKLLMKTFKESNDIDLSEINNQQYLNSTNDFSIA